MNQDDEIPFEFHNIPSITAWFRAGPSLLFPAFDAGRVRHGSNACIDLLPQNAFSKAAFAHAGRAPSTM